MPKTNPRQFENLNLGNLSPNGRMLCLEVIRDEMLKHSKEITECLNYFGEGEAKNKMIDWRDAAEKLAKQCQELYRAEVACI